MGERVLEMLSWFFDGIGTELLVLIVSTLLGIEGYKLYKNRQSQKAWDGSVQMQTNGPNSPIGDYVCGDKYILQERDELDTRNVTSYTNAQIEAVISKGNDATRRKWCLELITNQKPDYLIKNCLSKMQNDKEKYSLLQELAQRSYVDTEYFQSLLGSLSSAVYQLKAIELCIEINRPEGINNLFPLISNNKYIFDSLVSIFGYDRTLFEVLYNSGKCFSNKTYGNKMKEWLKHKK